ncbi:MAG: ASPIC/UnbV domain-containing protein, partial [Rubripirellula sp.]
HFELADSDGKNEYFAGSYVGRAMASLDFNRDGRQDLAIGHLDHPLAILRNDTESPGHWLQLEFVGTESERGAVGAKATVWFDGQRSTHWTTAGDGFLCCDEAVIDIGLGECKQVDKIEIVWPSGLRSELEGINVDARYLLIEDQPTPFAR